MMPLWPGRLYLLPRPLPDEEGAPVARLGFEVSGSLTAARTRGCILVAREDDDEGPSPASARTRFRWPVAV
jgi:hypothetical protein